MSRALWAWREPNRRDGRQVGEVVLPGHPGRGELVPQRRPGEAEGPLGVGGGELRREAVVRDAVGLRGVHVVAVGVRAAHPRVEVPVERGEVLHDPVDDGQVVTGVVAQGVAIGSGARAVVAPAVGDAVAAFLVEDLEAAAVVAVVRIAVGVAGPVLLAVDAEVVGRTGGMGGARVEAHVRAVTPPAEEVVGGAVLHHHHHHVVDVALRLGSAEERRGRAGDVHELGGAGGAGATEGGHAGPSEPSLQERTAIDRHGVSPQLTERCPGLVRLSRGESLPTCTVLSESSWSSSFCSSSACRRARRRWGRPLTQPEAAGEPRVRRTLRERRQQGNRHRVRAARYKGCVRDFARRRHVRQRPPADRHLEARPPKLVGRYDCGVSQGDVQVFSRSGRRTRRTRWTPATRCRRSPGA